MEEKVDRFTSVTRGLLLLSLLVPVWTSTCRADAAEDLSVGQTVYVPAYSHIYSGNRESVFLLTITLSIRNVDPVRSINVTTVDYYETQGKLLQKQLEKPLVLPPLGSTRYVIPQGDEAGGSGANFIVTWTSDLPANPPIVEAIMIGAQLNQGISFTSRGRAIHLH